MNITIDKDDFMQLLKEIEAKETLIYSLRCKVQELEDKLQPKQVFTDAYSQT